MAQKTIRRLSDWVEKFPDRQMVQPDENDNTLNGAFLSGESAVIVSGPPKLTGNIADLIPIGLTQQAQLSQNKELNQIFEIGGRVPFFIPGRVAVRASLSRVIFDGPSLFYALYRKYDDSGSIVIPEPKNVATPYDVPTNPYPEDGSTSEPGLPSSDTQTTPGYYWINLASTIFNKPIGLGFILFDMKGRPFGGAYLEGCYVQSHNFGVSANQTVLAENVSLSATRLKPLRASTIPSREAF